MNIQQILNSIFKRTKHAVNNEKRQRVAADGVLRNEINELKSNLSSTLKRRTVQSLPTTNIDTNTIYMVLDSNSEQSGNIYNEYLYINNKWELIGTTEARGPVYVAGNNIEIDNNVISSIGSDIVTGYASDWSEKIWDEPYRSYGQQVWTDGENVYYSEGSKQYVLDKATNTWLAKTWVNEPNMLVGICIWTDGENIYYSNNSDQCVLDKSTSTWSAKTWSGLTQFYGYCIWTDGDNIYYSNGSSQYVLDKTTSTWSTKTWNGLSTFDGDYVWTDGESIYYSHGEDQCVLDKATSTWSAKTWTYLNISAEPEGYCIWTDGNSIYHSGGSSSEQYVLNKSTSTWSAAAWNGLSTLNGNEIWTDGNNIYYSDGSSQYVLDKATHSVPALHKVAETGDYNNLKNKLTAGTGINIINGVVSASGGFYRHLITWSLGARYAWKTFSILILTDNETPFTKESFYNYLNHSNLKIPCGLVFSTADTIFLISYIYAGTYASRPTINFAELSWNKTSYAIIYQELTNDLEYSLTSFTDTIIV